MIAVKEPQHPVEGEYTLCNKGDTIGILKKIIDQVNH